MRYLAILLFCFSIISCNSQTTDNSQGESSAEPIAMAEGIAQQIIDGDRKLNLAAYFTQDELKEFMGSVTPAIPESVIEKEVSNYDTNLKKFKTSYGNNFKELNLSMSGCAEIDWKKCSIDSTTYDYKILVPQGKDEKIVWPESVDYIPSTGKMTCCTSYVFISENEKQYVMQIEFWIFDNDAKFYSNLKAPRIARIK